MNAITIEQTSDQAKLAFELHQNASIQLLRITRAKLNSQLTPEGPGAPLSVAFTFKSKRVHAPFEVLRLEVAFRMTGTEELNPDDASARPEGVRAEAAAPALLIDCVYEVDYQLHEGFAPTEPHIRAFKDGNAIFNAWPYFREYLHTSLQRMGLPPLTAPFLRLQLKGVSRKRVK
jgi:hypothetical protein